MISEELAGAGECGFMNSGPFGGVTGGSTGSWDGDRHLIKVTASWLAQNNSFFLPIVLPLLTTVLCFILNVFQFEEYMMRHFLSDMAHREERIMTIHDSGDSGKSNLGSCILYFHSSYLHCRGRCNSWCSPSCTWGVRRVIALSVICQEACSFPCLKAKPRKTLSFPGQHGILSFSLLTFYACAAGISLTLGRVCSVPSRWRSDHWWGSMERS